MKVLHVSGARSWGGNEQQLMYLIDELAGLGVEQKIFCFTGTPLFEEVKNHPVEILAMEYKKPHTSAYRKFFRNLVEQHKIHVIHLHTSDSVTGYVLTDLLYSLKTPTLFARKGIRRKTGFLSKLKYNYRNIDKILCISKYVEKHFREILSPKNQEKLVTVYNGVKVEKISKDADFQLREKLQLEDEIFLIGNIANHTNAKDLPVLLDTLHHLVYHLDFKKVHLVQIGHFSKLTPELQQKIEELKLELYITMMGFLNKASAYQSQFDVFFMTSEREGGPSSVVEAFYNKAPVISTRVGIVDEVIKDGYNGFTTEIKQPRELAKKIHIFVTNPDLAEKFRERSYKMFLETFTAERLGRDTLKVYEDMLKNPLR